MTDPRADSPPSAKVSARPSRVLMVDDDAGSRRLVMRALESMGYLVEGTGDGAEAMEMIAAQPPDIVLLDLDLPGLNGAEICTRLRHHQREELRIIPIVMLTAHDGEREEVACLAAGANDFVAKPIGRAALSARIATQLRLRALNDALRLQNDELERWRTAQNADLDAAQMVQRAILPVMEETPGWKIDAAFSPIIQVGGDIYGLEAARDGQVLWLADATGHGVAAALCTSLIALLFQRAAALSDPGKILSQVNAGMRRIFRGRSMMSAACVLLLPDGALRFAGAGHPPLLVRRGDGRVESVASRGTVVGVLDDPVFPAETLQLAPGETALLLTDGLYSARHPDGKRRVLEEIAPAFSQDRAVSSLIERMRGGSAFDDDVTAISIQHVV